jgi:hypothetical protein
MLLGNQYKGENKRAKFDRYNTPIEPVYAFCDKVAGFNVPKNILDPCAGDGTWGLVYKKLCGNTPFLVGVDIDPMIEPALEFDKWINYDFLQKDFADTKFDVIISNPPFSLSEEFIHKGLSLLSPRGVMAYMLNLTFMSSIGREERLFNNGLQPQQIIVSSRRIDFTGQGSPHTEIGMFIWYRPYLGASTRVEWLDWEKHYEKQKDRFGFGWGSLPLR